MNLKERLINGIYGQAVSDAVGNPFEFRTKINPLDVISYADSTDVLTISDDTQMCLYGFQGISNMNSYGTRIEKQVEYSFTDAYIDWYYTQHTDPLDHLEYENGLSSFKSMFSTQAPGYTCLNALRTLTDGKPVINDSCGCGSVMRLLPLISLYDQEKNNVDEVVRLGQISGAITHKHIQNDLAISRYIQDACIIVSGGTPVNRYPSVTDINRLGDGWTALSCVEMAIWSYHTANTFDELLQLSICHNGDSESVAAVAGSLWGLSSKEVPDKYIQKLDALDAIKYTISKIG